MRGFTSGQPMSSLQRPWQPGLAVLAWGVCCGIAAASAGDPTAAEAGVRFGQAKGATQICPGARLLPKAETLASAYAGADLAAFNEQAGKTLENWKTTFACQDWDQETKHTTSCRQMRIASCNMAWKEIGPEGNALPGLIDFRP